jgi:hypothetical protein
LSSVGVALFEPAVGDSKRVVKRDSSPYQANSGPCRDFTKVVNDFLKISEDKTHDAVMDFMRETLPMASGDLVVNLYCYTMAGAVEDLISSVTYAVGTPGTVSLTVPHNPTDVCRVVMYCGAATAPETITISDPDGSYFTVENVTAENSTA